MCNLQYIDMVEMTNKLELNVLKHFNTFFINTPPLVPKIHGPFIVHAHVADISQCHRYYYDLPS